VGKSSKYSGKGKKGEPESIRRGDVGSTADGRKRPRAEGRGDPDRQQNRKATGEKHAVGEEGEALFLGRRIKRRKGSSERDSSIEEREGSSFERGNFVKSSSHQIVSAATTEKTTRGRKKTAVPPKVHTW